MDVTLGARRCGLGTFLMMLCLVDSDMNGANGNVNGGLAEVNDALEALDITKYREAHDWVRTHCRSIWMLEFTADKAAAKGYFDAALKTGFTEMLLREADDDSIMHGPDSTEYWKEKYNPRNGLILWQIDVRLAHWFFCKLL